MARISSKLERAVRALLVLQGKAAWTDCFISNDSRTRSVLPNRTVLVHTEIPTRKHRTEGECHFGIQHHFAGTVQPGVNEFQQRTDMDAFVNSTEDTMFGLGDVQSLNGLADAITAAGRWLAQTDDTEEGDKIAEQNEDMLNFRCDWVKSATPYLTRGQAEHSQGSTTWVEILNFVAGCSTASVSN